MPAGRDRPVRLPRARGRPGDQRRGVRDEAALSRLRSDSNGRDPETPLAIDHGFLRDERDVEVLTEGFERLRELVASEAISPYAGRELRPGAEVDSEQHTCEQPRAASSTRSPPAQSGRCYDERCRVLGFDNLHVVDASAIPTIPRANTNLTTIALAERAAEWL